VRARGEEERASRAGEPPVAEGEAPQAVDRDRLAVAASQRAVVRPATVVLAVRVHATVAEVADEEIAAVTAEAARSEGESPRRIQRPHAVDACEELPAQVELVDVAAGRSIVAVDGRAPDEADEDAAAERADAVRRVPVRDPSVDECT